MFHYLRYRAFAHETEDREKVRAALRHAAQDEKISFEEEAVEGSHKNRILILEGETRSAPAIKRFFATLLRDDPAGFARLQEEAARRLDENLNFFLRLDKQEAYLGRLALASDEDAITVRGKIRSWAPGQGDEAVQDSLLKLEAFLGDVAGRTRR